MVGAAGIFQTFSNGWDIATTQISRAYAGACNLTHAGWQRFMQFGAVQKTANFAGPYFTTAANFCKSHYPTALKFKWSNGTAVATISTLLVAGAILRARQSELSRINKDIARLEAKQKALGKKEPAEELTKGEAKMLRALQIRREELQPKAPEPKEE